VAEAVRAKSLAGVEVITLGMKPASLLHHLSGRRAVCVVDAARCNDASPGTLIETDSPLSPWERVSSLLKKRDRHLTTIIFRGVDTVGSEPVPLFQQAVRAGCGQQVSSSAPVLALSPSGARKGEYLAVHLIHDSTLSTHGLSVADEIKLAERLGTCPKHVWLVAVVADSVEVGRPVGEVVLRQVPAAAARIADWAGSLLSETEI
jgi:Ni,Fe-hydrogenase maturation factor